MRRRNRVNDPQYLKWIRSLVCVIVSRKCRGFVEAHHAGIRGLGQRAEDNTAIPLCVRHHRLGEDSVHRLGKRFWQRHNLDRDDLILGYQKAFRLCRPARETPRLKFAPQSNAEHARGKVSRAPADTKH
jgi:hypothetical protein